MQLSHSLGLSQSKATIWCFPAYRAQANPERTNKLILVSFESKTTSKTKRCYMMKFKADVTFKDTKLANKPRFCFCASHSRIPHWAVARLCQVIIFKKIAWYPSQRPVCISKVWPCIAIRSPARSSQYIACSWAWRHQHRWRSLSTRNYRV